jgi:hypothetical protein
LFVKKLIVDDFYFISHYFSNINTDGFIDGKSARKKKITSIISSVIPLMRKPCHITDREIKPW